VQGNDAPYSGGPSGIFIWLQGKDSTILGNTFAGPTMYTIRANEFSRTLIAYNTFTNYSRANLNMQRGDHVYVSHNTFTGMTVGFGPLGGPSGKDDPDWVNARTNWIVVESNKMDFTDPRSAASGNLSIGDGAQNMMVRNNVILKNDGESIVVLGYNKDFNRLVSNLHVVNNTTINNGKYGVFLKLFGRADGIWVENNVYRAPNSTMINGDTAAISVNEMTLDSFRSISNNLWDLKPCTWDPGAMFYVWAGGFDGRGMLTPAEWAAYSQVNNDLYTSATLDGSYRPSGTVATKGKKVAGVFADFYGKLRPANGSWSLGAVQA
jgi:hypothetical protein